MSVKKTSKSKLEPSFRVFVICRKGDLVIDDVKLKSGVPFLNGTQKNRMAAAKAFIRSRLVQDGLSNASDDEELIEITIAESTVIEEVL